MQLKKINYYTNIKSTNNLTLSIQVSLDGFCFLLYDDLQKQVVHLEEYNNNDEAKNPEKLVIHLDELFQQNKHLQYNFTKVKVIHQNDLYTIVPTKYFDENHLKNYLNYTVKTLSTDFYAFDNLAIIDAKTVYIPYVNINNFIFQHFGEFEYEHYQTLLINGLIEQNNFSETVFYIDVNTEKFQLIAIKNKELLLTNSFEYATKEDFLYYILFTLEQLKLEVEKCQIFVFGKIDIQTETYAFLSAYLKNVEIFKPKEKLKNNQIENENHFYTLLNA